VASEEGGINAEFATGGLDDFSGKIFDNEKSAVRTVLMKFVEETVKPCPG
jgi:hypothetical protein